MLVKSLRHYLLIAIPIGENASENYGAFSFI